MILVKNLRKLYRCTQNSMEYWNFIQLSFIMLIWFNSCDWCVNYFLLIVFDVSFSSFAEIFQLNFFKVFLFFCFCNQQTTMLETTDCWICILKNVLVSMAQNWKLRSSCWNASHLSSCFYAKKIFKNFLSTVPWKQRHFSDASNKI